MEVENERPDDLLGPKEAARILGVARGYINQLVAEGKLEPSTRTPGGHMRFRRDYLHRIAAEWKRAGMTQRLRDHVGRIQGSKEDKGTGSGLWLAAT